MVAAAVVMTALINKQAKENTSELAKDGLAFGPTYAMVGDNPNAGVDPEVIAPLSKLKDMMAGGWYDQRKYNPFRRVYDQRPRPRLCYPEGEF